MAETESFDSKFVRDYGGSAVSALSAVAATLIWLGYVSDGFTARGLLDGVYEIQAAALARGSLTIAPGPFEVFYYDVLIYGGSYYFYWGLLPSAVFLALESVAGRIAAHYVIVFGTFFSLIFFLQLLILEILESSATGDSLSDLSKYAGSTILAWVLLFAIPYPARLGWFFGRFVVYEQQILLGLAFAMPGLYCLVKGIKRRSIHYLAIAVGLFALGAWTRVTWFPFAWILLFVSFILIVRWSDEASIAVRLNRAAMFMGPALVLLIGLMAVNYVRFDSPFDFGVRHQDPAHYVYFRNLKMFFSPATRIWNAVFNAFSYFCPPQWVMSLGLFQSSFAQYEGFPPSFFFLNPQFLPMLILVPLGIYKALKGKSDLLVPVLVMLVTVMYLNIIIGFFGTIVIMRYFVEFCYFLMLLFLAVLLIFLRPRWGIPIMMLSLILYIPDPFNGFLFSRPELRTVNGWPDVKALTSPPGRTPFLEPRAMWPDGKLSVENLGKLTSYGVMGVNDGGGGNLLGTDIFCAYLIPKDMPSTPCRATLSIGGLKSLAQDGTATVFFENRPIGSEKLSPATTRNVEIKLPFSIPRRAPYQIMVLFLPAGQSYLEPRGTGEPVVLFREILLQAQAAPEATSARP